SAVEHDRRDPRLLRPLGDRLAHRRRTLRLRAGELAVGDRHERAALDVVHELRRHVLERAIDHEARPLGRPCNLLANSQMAAYAPLRPVRLANDPHHLPPALPALRRICSPAYLIPFPLYGSGGRSLRISAATWPTTSLLAPSTRICVGVVAVSLIPSGAWYSIGCEKPSAMKSPYGRVSAR